MPRYKAATVKVPRDAFEHAQCGVIQQNLEYTAYAVNCQRQQRLKLAE
jgi:hypothetical protein